MAESDSIPLQTESLDSIPENMKSLYVPNDAGGFKFEAPDVGALKRAKDHEKTARQEQAAKTDSVTAQLAELQGKFDTAETNRMKSEASKSGNYEALEKSFDEKAAKIRSELQSENDSLRSQLQETTIGLDASKLSSRLFGDDAAVLHNVVRDRLEMVDGKTMVLDAKGQHSALTLDELHNEIYNDKRYSRFVVGSNASGGGANGSSAKGGGAAQKKTMARSEFLKLPGPEKKSLMKEGVALT